MSGADMLADFILVILLGMTLGGGIALVLMLAQAFRGRRDGSRLNDEIADALEKGGATVTRAKRGRAPHSEPATLQ